MAHTEHLRAGSLSRFFYEMREGARRQGNVVFALIFREIKSRSGQDNYGMLSLLGIALEPAVGVIVLSCFWYVMRRQEIQGVHVVMFLTVSMIGFSIMRRALATVPRSVKSTKSFYTFPNVKPFDAILARFIIELTLTVTGGIFLLFLCWWFLDITINMDGFLEGMGIFALLILAAFGTSLFLGVYGTLFPTILTIVSMSSRALFILSGVIHPISELPVEATNYIALNPVAHALELLRYYLLGLRPFQGASANYFAAFTFTMLALGFVSYYANRQKLIER